MNSNLNIMRTPLVKRKKNQLDEARTIALDLRRIVVPSLYDKNKTDKNFEGEFNEKISKNLRKLKNKNRDEDPNRNRRR
ncbi:MAG: hypothetical protein P0116_11765 [Candidatus Nitrosocosmicus sp.]|nr:hypothetical protein [Candidatus Nitrosocosmicus sp.]